MLIALGLPPGKNKAWKAFRSFWCRPWFKRIWVIQEFILGRDVTVICGEWERNWRVFLAAVVKINDLDIPDAVEIFESNAGSESMLMLCELRAKGGHGQHVQSRFKEIDLEPLKSLGLPSHDGIGKILKCLKLSGAIAPQNLKGCPYWSCSM
jgi:hypothetical protein